jgi:hypothetical protein
MSRWLVGSSSTSLRSPPAIRRVGLQQPALQQPSQNGGLSSAMRADQTDAGASADLQVQTVQDTPPAELLDDPAQAERGGGGQVAGHAEQR